MAKALTAIFVHNMRGSDRRIEVADGILPGFYLIVQPSGAKSWAIRYRLSNKTKKHTVGTYPRLTLAAARDLAREALRAVSEGRDPSQEKLRARSADPALVRITFSFVLGEFIAKYVRPNTKASSAKETERLLTRNVLPVWKDLEIGAITKPDVIGLLDTMVYRGASVSANRTLAAVRRLFNWCIDRDIIESSPCDRVRSPTVEHSRDRVLTDDEIARIIQATDSLGWPFGPFTQLLIYTGQRRNEVSGMRWSEIDKGTAMWTIPSSRSKNGNAHDVPLSQAVIDILDCLPRIDATPDYVFSTTGRSPISGYSRAKASIDSLVKAKRVEGFSGTEIVPTARWTFHDLRRTAASGMARLGIALPVIEKVLNHTSGSFSGVVGVYQRHSYQAEKRAALDAWAATIKVLAYGKPHSLDRAAGGL